MGKGREPHLNLPEDVMTPRRTLGQWEAVTGKGRGPEESGLGRIETVGGVVWPSREKGEPRDPGLPEVVRPPLVLPAWYRVITKRERRSVRGGAAEAAQGRGFL